MSLEPSRDLVLKKLRDCFPNLADAADALAALDTYGELARERVQLAILMQSEGNIERLRRLVAGANQDYRDVLLGAEFPEEYQAPSQATPQELAEIRARDRDRYEAWLRSDRA